MIFIETNSDLKKHLNDIANLKYFGLDTETNSLDPFTGEILLTQIGNEEIQYVIDSRKVNLSILKPILEDKNIYKIGSHLNFDYQFLKHNYKIELENIVDVLLAERILNAGKINFKTPGYFALEGLTKRYLNIELYKDIRDSFPIHQGDFSQEQLEYAAKDVIMPVRIFREHQRKLLLQESLMSTFNLECNCVPVFADIEYNGFYLNKDKWIKLYENNIRALKKYRIKAREIFKDVLDTTLLNEIDLNLNADAQMLYAFRKLGYNISSTGEDILQIHTPKEIHDPILKYREYNKDCTTYGMGFVEKIHPLTGRVHSDIFQIGTETARPTSKDPNLLNLPRDEKYRSCFTTQDEGSKIITTDYVGQELRIMTEITQEPAWIGAFQKDINVHEMVGTTLFEQKISKQDNPEVYAITKNIDFLAAYGGGPKALLRNALKAELDFDYDRCINILNKFKKLYPILNQKLEDISYETLQIGYSTSIGGRKRYFPLKDISDMPGKNRNERYNNYKKRTYAIQREGRNHSIQGSAADILKTSLVILRNKIKQLNKQNELLICLPPYDEIVCESKKNHKENQQLIEQSMLQGQEAYQSIVPAAVESIIADCWSK